MDNAKRMRAEPTEAEQRLWSRLRNQQLGYKFRRQHRIAGYIADFVCVERKLVVEADGSQHLQQAEYDHERARVLQAAGYRLLRFWNHDILKDTEQVLGEIWRALNDESVQSTHGLIVRGKGSRSHSPSPRPSPPQAGEREKADWQPTASFDALRLRARLNALIRAFFAERDVLEVETPVLSRGGNSEPNIASFSLQFSGRTDGAPRTRWLRTSPEYPLKRLLAAGLGDCYELGRVFRDGEAGGRHNPEFTMLEWYRVGWNHLRLIDETAELVRAALSLVGRDATLRVVAYRDLYRGALGIDPFAAGDGELRNALGDVRIDPEGLTRDDWLDLLMTHRLQPAFAADELLAVTDWPATQCALARLRDGDDGVQVAERFELYLGPVELANGYHELADATEQHARFARDLERRRARGDAEPPLDAAFLAALDAGLPDCAGVALGMDRLLMAMLGTERIADVLAFDFARS
jgi:lysyl-tRNA synthetase class 2